MNIAFYKYHGTGNDFIIFDNRTLNFQSENLELVAKLCDRRFGIGADGLILLEDDLTTDFKMVYYNSDGHLSSMCGNGGRCIVHFARHIGVIDSETSFTAVDGVHHATIMGDQVDLSMSDVTEVELTEAYSYMDTGSPHYSVWCDNIEKIDINAEAREIRYNKRFTEEGTNVNFLTWSDGAVQMRTYERGVEGETLSCGTGIVAAALYASLTDKLGTDDKCTLYTKGGQTEVTFAKEADGTFKNIHLIGPATLIYKGNIDV